MSTPQSEPPQSRQILGLRGRHPHRLVAASWRGHRGSQDGAAHVPRVPPLPAGHPREGPLLQRLELLPQLANLPRQADADAAPEARGSGGFAAARTSRSRRGRGRRSGSSPSCSSMATNLGSSPRRSQSRGMGGLVGQLEKKRTPRSFRNSGVFRSSSSYVLIISGDFGIDRRAFPLRIRWCSPLPGTLL